MTWKTISIFLAWEMLMLEGLERWWQVFCSGVVDGKRGAYAPRDDVALKEARSWGRVADHQIEHDEKNDRYGWYPLYAAPKIRSVWASWRQRLVGSARS